MRGEVPGLLAVYQSPRSTRFRLRCRGGPRRWVQARQSEARLRLRFLPLDTFPAPFSTPSCAPRRRLSAVRFRYIRVGRRCVTVAHVFESRGFERRGGGRRLPGEPRYSALIPILFCINRETPGSERVNHPEVFDAKSAAPRRL